MMRVPLMLPNRLPWRAPLGLRVNPRDNQLKIQLEHPAQNLPGASIPMTIRLSDPDGNPLNGEVTLWLVDRAVLALGREERLDPVPSFMDEVKAHLRIRDTRNEVVGDLNVNETPGGDGDFLTLSYSAGKATVRKNFQPVPYYNPLVQVVDGVATLTIDLSDDLTDFAVRAVVHRRCCSFWLRKICHLCSFAADRSICAAAFCTARR